VAFGACLELRSSFRLGNIPSILYYASKYPIYRILSCQNKTRDSSSFFNYDFSAILNMKQIVNMFEFIEIYSRVMCDIRTFVGGPTTY